MALVDHVHNLDPGKGKGQGQERFDKPHTSELHTGCLRVELFAIEINFYRFTR